MYTRLITSSTLILLSDQVVKIDIHQCAGYSIL